MWLLRSWEWVATDFLFLDYLDACALIHGSAISFAIQETSVYRQTSNALTYLHMNFRVVKLAGDIPKRLSPHLQSAHKQVLAISDENRYKVF